MISKGNIGPGYWQRFMKWKKHPLVSKKYQKYELDWKDLSTYQNMYNTYNKIYKEMCRTLHIIELWDKFLSIKDISWCKK